jgi:hypothetical protein
MGRQFVILDVPAALKAALVADAIERGISQSDVALEIISRRFGVPFEASGRTGAQLPAADAPGLGIRRVSDQLHAAVHSTAYATRTSMERILLRVLHEHYSLDYSPPARAPRRPRRPSPVR